MATFTRQHLSGSTSGRCVPVGATSTPGTLIHTAIAGIVSFDEVYLFASNVSAAPVKITVEWGGVTDPGDHIVKQLTLPPNSPPLAIVTGECLNGGLIVRAFADVANAINLSGYINRIAA